MIIFSYYDIIQTVGWEGSLREALLANRISCTSRVSKPWDIKVRFCILSHLYSYTRCRYIIILLYNTRYYRKMSYPRCHEDERPDFIKNQLIRLS